MFLAVSGSVGYRGNITDLTYEETDWGSKADDAVRFADVLGREVWLNLRQIVSMNFKGATSPPPGDYDLYRVSANWVRGAACDCLVTEDVKDDLLGQMASGMEDKIISFTSAYGVEVRLITRNITKIVIMPEDLNIPNP